MGRGDSVDCHFWVRRNKPEGFVVLEPLAKDGVIGFNRAGLVQIYPDVSHYMKCRLFPEIIERESFKLFIIINLSTYSSDGYPKAYRSKVEFDSDDENEVEQDDQLQGDDQGRGWQFERRNAAQTLHMALQGCDIATILKLIARKPYAQRLEIAEQFKHKFEKEIEKAIVESVHGYASLVLTRMTKPRTICLVEDLEWSLKCQPVDVSRMNDLILFETFQDWNRNREIFSKSKR